MFAIQIDESSDISNKAILFCYVRYIDYSSEYIKKLLLRCIKLVSHTSPEIFDPLKAY